MPRLLSIEGQQAFAQRLATYAREQSLKRCVVILHGGEPLLAGVDAIIQFAATLRAATPAVDIGLQTNGLLITEAALHAFSEARIAVSLSLDGPQEANDRHRTTRKGRSSFRKTLEALELLKKFPDVFAGVIAVIDPQVPPETIFSFFADHAPPKLDFLLPDAHHMRPPPGRDANPHVYREWLTGAFDLWLEKYPQLRVRTFEALLDAAVGLPSGTDAFGLGDVSLISIETDGSYHDLDVLKIVGEGSTRIGGSVFDTDIADVARSPAIAAHRALLSKEGLSATCQACPEVDVCGGGSLPHRFGSGGFNNPTVYCGEMLSLISHIRRRLTADLHVQAASNDTIRSLPDFRLSDFEAAEAGPGTITRLWNAARDDYERQLSELLEKAPAEPSEIVGLARNVQHRGESVIRGLASRPGTVAWLKAMNCVQAGRQLFSVDGVPLDPQYTYLQYLHDLPDDHAEGLALGEDDEWLRKPFGSGVVFEPVSVVRAAAPIVHEALDIIQRWRPALAAEMRMICRAVQYIRDPAADPEKIVSFSDNTVPGALFVSVMQNDRLIDPFDLADSLIHEYRHQKLYLLERIFPMVERNAQKIISPWRDDLRPPSGLLHAIFVFVELRRFWQHVRDWGPSRLHNRSINQLADTDARLEEGLVTLRQCPLTPAGHAMADVLDAARRHAQRAA